MAETAVAAWREGFRGIVPDEIDPERAWSPEQLEQRVAGSVEDDRSVLVADVGGVVRGLVVLGRCRDRGAPADHGEVIALYVHPDNWRQGLGRRLVVAALDSLARQGYSVVRVWTLAESPRNISFYESLGFRLDGATQRRPSFGSPLEVRLRITPQAGGA
jgi:GNAT superfamily N-acetyltransferase